MWSFATSRVNCLSLRWSVVCHSTQYLFGMPFSTSFWPFCRCTHSAPGDQLPGSRLSRIYMIYTHDTWRTVCHKIFEPFAARHLNRLPQDIYTVCLYTWREISEPKAGIACLWLSHTRVMATARKGHTKCSPKQTASSHFVLENVPPICPQSMEKFNHLHSLFASALRHAAYDCPIGKPYKTTGNHVCPIENNVPLWKTMVSNGSPKENHRFFKENMVDQR